MNSPESRPPQPDVWSSFGSTPGAEVHPPTPLTPPTEVLRAPTAPPEAVVSGVGHLSMDAVFGPPTGLNTRAQHEFEKSEHAERMKELRDFRKSWVNPKYEPEDVRLSSLGSLGESSDIKDKKGLWNILVDREKIIEEPRLDAQGRLVVDDDGNILTTTRKVTKTTQGYGAFQGDNGQRVLPRGPSQNRQANRIWAHRRHEGHLLAELAELEGGIGKKDPSKRTGLPKIDPVTGKSFLRGAKLVPVTDSNQNVVPAKNKDGSIMTYPDGTPVPAQRVVADENGSIPGNWRMVRRIRSAEKRHKKLSKKLHSH